MTVLIPYLLGLSSLASSFIHHPNADPNDTPTFKVTLSRSTEGAPSISVHFSDGIQDELVLENYKLHRGSKGGCNYIGHLKNSPSSSVAVTGCMNEPEDRMEITLISEHNFDKMYSIDVFGNSEVVPNPFANGQISRAILVNRDDNEDDDEWKQKGDEEVDETEENAADFSEIKSIPSKLKAVIKFGYEEGIKKQLAERNEPQFEEWIESVMAHTQAHFSHPSLGTSIQFEAQGSPMFKANATWYADNSMRTARAATTDANLKDVDVMSWWCGRGGGSVGGMAYLGSLCNQNGVNINEIQRDASASGFVLAHELGHNFGMKHDFDSKHGGSDGPCNKRGIMSYGSYSFKQWSTCSKSDWEHHYSSEFWGNGCLEDISDPCTRDTCKNGGTCTETSGGGFTCNCPPSVTGGRCENNPSPGCQGGNSCCTSSNKCGEGEGDCDSNSDCHDGLLCGRDNCPLKYGGDGWDKGDDCCFKPNLVTKSTCQSQTKGNLVTSKGKGKIGTCVFPFFHKGITYNTCAESEKYGGVGWCSFDIVYKGKWGYCTSECPSGTCPAQEIECLEDKHGKGSNGTCVFPFTKRYRTYDSCADPGDYGGVGWCAFDSAYKKGRWGYCTLSCPLSKPDPCDGISCSVPGETCVNGICKCGSSCSCADQKTGSYCDSENSQCRCSAELDACKQEETCDDETCILCAGGNSCCTEDNQCGVGAGDCDSDADCKTGLKCGTDNCGKCEKGENCGEWQWDDDCCYQPE